MAKAGGNSMVGRFCRALIPDGQGGMVKAKCEIVGAHHAGGDLICDLLVLRITAPEGGGKGLVNSVRQMGAQYLTNVGPIGESLIDG